MFRICSEFSVMFRICSEFSVMFRILLAGKRNMDLLNNKDIGYEHVY
jgi:hypothetical protein